MKSPIILSYKILTRDGQTNPAYSNAIESSGGVLQTIDKKEDIDILIDKVGGVLLPGGADVNPKLYGEEKKEYTQKSNDERDEFELYLIEKAMEKKLPILGICRGIQTLNIKFGGTLYQDLEIEMENSVKHDWHSSGSRSQLAHDVSFVEGSALQKILGVKETKVNSLHHQGIKELGKGLVAVGFTPDGLIEAVEMRDYPYLVGVQWHPEELTDNPIWKNLFDNFIEVCSK